MNKWLPFAILPMGLALLCMAPGLPHQAHLWGLQRKYRALVHPPDSRSLARESELGLLEGNGNHCDYFVGEVRVTRLSVVQVNAFYGPRVEVEFPVGAARYAMSPRNLLLDIAAGVKLEPGELIYLVSMFDQEEPGMDMRCH